MKLHPKVQDFISIACADFPNVVAERRSYAHDASDATLRRTTSLCLCFALCVMTQQNATFWGLSTPAGAVTPKFELGRHFCAIPKFHHPMFTRSEAIVLTYKPTNPQTNRHRQKHPTFFATLQRWVISIMTFYHLMPDQLLLFLISRYFPV